LKGGLFFGLAMLVGSVFVGPVDSKILPFLYVEVLSRRCLSLIGRDSYAEASELEAPIIEIAMRCRFEGNIAFRRILVKALHCRALLREAILDYRGALEAYKCVCGVMCHKYTPRTRRDYLILINALCGLGNAYRTIGKTRDARRDFGFALKIALAVPGTQSVGYVIALAGDCVDISAIDDSITSRSELERIFERMSAPLFAGGNGIGFRSNQVALAACVRLAELYFEDHQEGSALALVEKVIEFEGKYRGIALTEMIFSDARLLRARVLSVSGHSARALSMLSDELGDLEKRFAEVGSGKAETELLSIARSCSDRLTAFLHLVNEYSTSDEAMLRTALQHVVRLKGIVLDYQLATKRVYRGDFGDALDRTARELEGTLQELRKLSLESIITTRAPEFRRFDSLYAERERLERELLKQRLAADVGKELGTVSLASVTEKISSGEALLEIVRLRENTKPRGWKAQYIAFAQEFGSPPRLVRLGEAAPIDESVANFLSQHKADNRHLKPSSNVAKQDHDIEQDPGAAIYAATLGPIRSILTDRCKRLLLSPDGDLLLVPFEVLPVAASKRVIDLFEITYLGSARDLLRTFPASGESLRSATVVAAPDFHDQSALEPVELAKKPTRVLPPFAEALSRTDKAIVRDILRDAIKFEYLPGAEKEGYAVRKLLTNAGYRVNFLHGVEATVTNIKSFGSPAVLHIATHAFYVTPSRSQLGGDNGDLVEFDPMFNAGIALAGANRIRRGDSNFAGDDDGFLLAVDAAGLNLDQTELVVLSACDTGLGQVQRGEGVFGFRRALMIAGARTIIVSAWKVPDGQTAELMEEFYRNLTENLTVGEALRYARLAIRQRYPDPFYWGAFFCQGDPMVRICAQTV
jgi:CHAT domain-containing protein